MNTAAIASYRLMFARTAVAVALFSLLGACGSESGTNPTIPANDTVVTRANLHPDSTAGWLYYSFDADSVVPHDEASTVPWDMRVAYLLCCGKTRMIAIQCNSGNAGPGSSRGAVVKNRFENITAVPSGVTLRAEDTLNPIVPLPVLGSDAVFLYQGAPNHTIQPSPDKVILLQTQKGRRLKLQFTSIYLDAPAVPTQLTPLGFYHFRYATIR